MFRVDVSTNGFESLYKELYDLPKIFKSRNYKKFIAEKCIKELNGIMEIKLNDQSSGLSEDIEIKKYRDGNEYEIGGDYILISNDSTLSQGEMYWVSEKTKERYPDGISIAYLIEYGTGIMGISNEDWQVNVPSPSKRKDGSWAYKRDGVLHKKVFGSSPKLIYTTLMQKVEENIQDWTIEYINKNL